MTYPVLYSAPARNPDCTVEVQYRETCDDFRVVVLDKSGRSLTEHFLSNISRVMDVLERLAMPVEEVIVWRLNNFNGLDDSFAGSRIRAP